MEHSDHVFETEIQQESSAEQQVEAALNQNHCDVSMSEVNQIIRDAATIINNEVASTCASSTVDEPLIASWNVASLTNGPNTNSLVGVHHPGFDPLINALTVKSLAETSNNGSSLLDSYANVAADSITGSVGTSSAFTTQKRKMHYVKQGEAGLDEIVEYRRFIISLKGKKIVCRGDDDNSSDCEKTEEQTQQSIVESMMMLDQRQVAALSGGGEGDLLSSPSSHTKSNSTRKRKAVNVVTPQNDSTISVIDVISTAAAASQSKGGETSSTKTPTKRASYNVKSKINNSINGGNDRAEEIMAKIQSQLQQQQQQLDLILARAPVSGSSPSAQQVLLFPPQASSTIAADNSNTAITAASVISRQSAMKDVKVLVESFFPPLHNTEKEGSWIKKDQIEEMEALSRAFEYGVTKTLDTYFKMIESLKLTIESYSQLLHQEREKYKKTVGESPLSTEEIQMNVLVNDHFRGMLDMIKTLQKQERRCCSNNKSNLSDLMKGQAAARHFFKMQQSAALASSAASVSNFSSGASSAFSIVPLSLPLSVGDCGGGGGGCSGETGASSGCGGEVATSSGYGGELTASGGCSGEIAASGGCSGGAVAAERTADGGCVADGGATASGGGIVRQDNSNSGLEGVIRAILETIANIEMIQNPLKESRQGEASRVTSAKSQQATLAAKVALQHFTGSGGGGGSMGEGGNGGGESSISFTSATTTSKINFVVERNSLGKFILMILRSLIWFLL